MSVAVYIILPGQRVAPNEFCTYARAERHFGPYA